MRGKKERSEKFVTFCKLCQYKRNLTMLDIIICCMIISYDNNIALVILKDIVIITLTIPIQMKSENIQ